MNEEENRKLKELLRIKKVEVHKELEIIMSQRIRIRTTAITIDHGEMISRIDLVLEGLGDV